jgi:hypothetical protein
MPHTLDDIKIDWANWPLGTPADNARMLAQDAARSMTAGDHAIASRFYAHSHQPIVFDEEDEEEDDDNDDLPPLEDAPVDVRTRLYLDHIRVQATKYGVGAHERPWLEPVPPCAGMFTYDLPETYHERKAAAKPASSSSSDDDDSGSWLNDDPHDGEMASRRFMPAPKPRGARVKREDWDKNNPENEEDADELIARLAADRVRGGWKDPSIGADVIIMDEPAASLLPPGSAAAALAENGFNAFLGRVTDYHTHNATEPYGGNLFAAVRAASLATNSEEHPNHGTEAQMEDVD